MAITITDPATLAALAAVKSGCRVCGPDGVAIGRFVPPLEVEFPETHAQIAAARRAAAERRTLALTPPPAESAPPPAGT